MTQLPKNKIEYLRVIRQHFVHKFQDDKGRNRVCLYFEILDKMFLKISF